MSRYRTDEFSLSVWEHVQASRAFAEAVQKFAQDEEMSKDRIVKNALAEVWRAGRVYQAADEQSQTKTDAAREFLQRYGNLTGKGVEIKG